MPRYSRTTSQLPKSSPYQVRATSRHCEDLGSLPADFFRSKKLAKAAARGDFESFANLIAKKLSRRGRAFRKMRNGTNEDRAASARAIHNELAALSGSFPLHGFQPAAANGGQENQRSKHAQSRKHSKKSHLGNGQSVVGKTKGADQAVSELGSCKLDSCKAFERIRLLANMLIPVGRVAPRKMASDWLAGWQGLKGRLDATNNGTPPSPNSNNLEKLAEMVADWGWSLLISEMSELPCDLTTTRDRLNELLNHFMDKEGAPLTAPLSKSDAPLDSSSQSLEIFRSQLALIAFAASLSQLFDGQMWTNEGDERYKQFVQKSVCWLDRPGGNCVPLLAFAMSTVSWKKSVGPRRWLDAWNLAKKDRRSPKKASSGRVFAYPLSSRQCEENFKKQGNPSFQSDEGKKACLRADWRPLSDRIFIDYSVDNVEVEVAAAGGTALRGAWGLSLNRDGSPLKSLTNWRCTCWFSDAEADYLELQRTYESDVRIDRQVLLSRVDGLSYWSETLVGPPKSQLEIRSTWSTAPGVSCEAESDVSALHLATPKWSTIGERKEQPSSKKKRAPQVSIRAVALASSADRSQSSEICWRTREDNILELSAATNTGGIFLPVVFDSHPERQNQTISWRPLTVSEGGAIVPSSRAAAYLLQSHPLKLFVFHSIVNSRFPRAALGHHTLHESIIGRFNEKGNIEPLVFVE